MKPLKNMQSSKLQINLKNLDDITQNTLNFFFSSNLCSFAEINLFDNEANLLIVDFNRGINEAFLKELTQKEQVALVLYFKDDEPFDNSRLMWLKKPIQVMELKKKIKQAHERSKEGRIQPFAQKERVQIKKQTPADIVSLVNIEDKIEPPKKPNTSSVQQLKSPEEIKKEFMQAVNNKHIKIEKKKKSNKNSHLFHAIHEETEKEIKNRYRAHKHVGSNPDVDLDDLDNLDKVYFEPEKYLYFHLLKATKAAHKQKQDMIIKTVSGNIYYHYKKHEFIHDFDSTKLRYMRSNTVFKPTKILPLEKKSQIILHHPLIVKHDEMIWQSALLASRGYLPAGTDVHKPVHLRYWPNYSKLQLFRYIIQITAAWSRHRISLADTAKKLKIPQRYVFTLYTAMFALECANISSDKSSFSGFDKGKSQSIFSKILTRMFGK